MTQTKDTKKATLLKRFHTVCTTKGLKEDEKRELVRSYGYESSKEMRTTDLIDAINKLQPGENMSHTENLNKWRKRVMAAVGAYLRMRGYDDNADNIKAIACRAGMAKKFNHISEKALIRIYSEFKRKADVADITDIIDSQLLAKSVMNN